MDPIISRNEKLLMKILGQDVELEPPQSRIEALLWAIVEQGGVGGGAYEVKGSYNTYADLIAAHPTGNAGDAYLVGDPSHIYVWLTDSAEWHDGGAFSAVAGQDGVGIRSITKTGTAGLVDTYTIRYTNDTTSIFTVTNGEEGEQGNGIASIEKTSTSGLVDTYTITYTDGTTSTYAVTNGEKGVGIQSVTKTGTAGLVDTYTIVFTDGTSTTFTVTNAFSPTIVVKSSTSSEYILTIITKDDEYDTPNLKCGGTPEGYADLVAKVNSIYRQTATSYNVVGTSEGSALAHTIYGMSVQDGTPTPSVPVEIQSAKADFRCVGKNLIPYPFYSSSGEVSGVTYTINDDDSIKANGTGTAIGFFSFIHRNQGKRKIILSPNNYVLRVEILGGSFIGQNSSYFTIVLREYTSPNGSYKDAVYKTVSSVSVGDVISLPFTISENDFTTYPYHNVWFEHHKDNVFNNFTFRYSIELASVTDTTYEPYQHTDVTTDLTLRAIEVASTDDYNLVRDGKYYIADTVDWSEDDGYVITRRVKEVTINSGDVTASSNPRYGIVLRTAFDPNEFSVRQAVRNNLLLSAFVSSTYENFISESGNGLAFFDGTNLRLRHDSMASTADWSTYLQSNPVKVIGVLITPTTELITSEQAQALLSLKTYDEATSISAIGDIEPSLDLEYSKDRNTALALTGHNLAHKNALKLNDINTALIELGGN